MSSNTNNVKAEEKKPQELHKLLSEDMVMFHVGPAKTPYYLHAKLLCSKSSAFKMAFSSRFKEAAERTMELPEDEPKIFQLFVHWLYGTHSTLSGPTDQKSIRTYLELYTFACQWLIPQLQNKITDLLYDCFLEKLTFSPDPEDVQYLYENTIDGCKMRLLLSETAARGFRHLEEDPAGEIHPSKQWQDALKSSHALCYDVLQMVTSDFVRAIGGVQRQNRYMSMASLGELLRFERHSSRDKF